MARPHVAPVVEGTVIGELLCEVLNTIMVRGHGGFDGPAARATAAQAAPRRPGRDADHVVDFAIQKQAALIYRLSGDYYEEPAPEL